MEQRTIFLRNIGHGVTAEGIRAVLDAAGLKATYHFISVPHVPRERPHYGCAFVCFRGSEYAEACRRHFNGRPFGNACGDKVCEVRFSMEERSVADMHARNRELGKMLGTMMFDEAGELYKAGEVEHVESVSDIYGTEAKPSHRRATPSNVWAWQHHPGVARGVADAPRTGKKSVKEIVKGRRAGLCTNVFAHRPGPVATSGQVPGHLAWLFLDLAMQTPPAAHAAWPAQTPWASMGESPLRDTGRRTRGAEECSGPYSEMDNTVDDILDDIVSQGMTAAEGALATSGSF